MTVKFRATRAFNYGGKDRLPGEVFDRGYLQNDELLMSEKIRYVSIVDPGDLSDLLHCEVCNRDFINQAFYHSHLGMPQHLPIVSIPDPPPTKMEDEFPSGVVIDGSGRVTTGRK